MYLAFGLLFHLSRCLLRRLPPTTNRSHLLCVCSNDNQLHGSRTSPPPLDRWVPIPVCCWRREPSPRTSSSSGARPRRAADSMSETELSEDSVERFGCRPNERWGDFFCWFLAQHDTNSFTTHEMPLLNKCAMGKSIILTTRVNQPTNNRTKTPILRPFIRQHTKSPIAKSDNNQTTLLPQPTL